MNIRRLTIIAAIIFAVGSGLLVLVFLASMRQQNAEAVATIPVFVANQDIPARIPITTAMFTVENREKRTLDPDAVTDPNTIAGQLSLITMPTGAVLTAAKMGRPSAVGLAVQLRPGMRAISVGVDRVKDVSGLIEPGDRVDVLAEGPKIGSTIQPAVAILRGVLVLGIGALLETAGATPSPDAQNAATVTLAVTPQQANILLTADENATLRLALRSPKESIRSEPTQSLIYASAPMPSVGAGGSGAVPAMGQLPPLSPFAVPPFSSAGLAGSGQPTVNGVTVINGATVEGT